MADRYHTPDGWTIEVVHLDEGERLRIRHHGFYIADVSSTDMLAPWVPAEELEHLERDTLILTSGCGVPRPLVGSCLGRYQIDLHPSALHLTVLDAQAPAAGAQSLLRKYPEALGEISQFGRGRSPERWSRSRQM